MHLCQKIVLPCGLVSDSLTCCMQKQPKVMQIEHHLTMSLPLPHVLHLRTIDNAGDPTATSVLFHHVKS